MHAELRAVMIEWRGPKIEPLFCGIYQEIAINRVLDPDTIKLMVKSTERSAVFVQMDFDAVGAHALPVCAAEDVVHNGNDILRHQANAKE